MDRGKSSPSQRLLHINGRRVPPAVRRKPEQNSSRFSVSFEPLPEQPSGIGGTACPSASMPKRCPRNRNDLTQLRLGPVVDRGIDHTLPVVRLCDVEVHIMRRCPNVFGDRLAFGIEDVTQDHPPTDLPSKPLIQRPC